MIRSRIVEKSRGIVFGLMVGRRFRFDDDCMHLNWGSELMMIRIRIACKKQRFSIGFACWKNTWI